MRYWITTQWPSPFKPPRPHRHIFLPHEREEPGLRVRLGDRVAIYEAKGGRSEIIFEEGKERVLKAVHNGRQGIVTLGEVISPMMSSGRGPSTYANGSEIWWRYKIETAKHNDGGFTPRSKVCEVLRFDEAYNFRGFGEKRSGLKEISEEQFIQIAELFNNDASFVTKDGYFDCIALDQEIRSCLREESAPNNLLHITEDFIYFLNQTMSAQDIQGTRLQALHALAESPSQVVTKAALNQHIFGYGQPGDLETTIHRLKKALKPMVTSWMTSGHPQLSSSMEKDCLIENVKGVGYRLALASDRVKIEP